MGTNAGEVGRRLLVPVELMTGTESSTTDEHIGETAEGHPVPTFRKISS